MCDKGHMQLGILNPFLFKATTVLQSIPQDTFNEVMSAGKRFNA